MIRFSEGLAQFASAGIDFAVATLILAVLSGILTQSLFDLGLRRVLQRWWVQAWVRLRGGDLTSWREGTRNGRIYALHYQRLCGQLSSYLQYELDTPAHWLLLPAMLEKTTLEALREATGPDRAQIRQTANAELEDALDDLQTLLANRSVIVTYYFCLVFSFSIIALLTLTDNQFTEITDTRYVLIGIGLVAGLMGPIFRAITERLLSGR
ncbi:MAG: hypothetical protein AAGI13_06990 [Pseudomonadota bacterium]